MTQKKKPFHIQCAAIALFFINGAIYASWGVHIPTIKEKFTLDEAMLSLVLLMVAAGPISIMTRIGAWVARVGSSVACTAGGVSLCIYLALLLWVPWLSGLIVLLVLFGISAGLMDVAINAEAVAVEEALRKPMMSMLHGVFSVGGAVGAALGGLALAHGVTPFHHLLFASLIGITVVLMARPALLSHAPAYASDQPRQSGRGLWLLGGMACVAFISEGAMYDWTAVYMRESLNAEYGMTSAAYAVFTAGMAVGRFCGDFVRTRIGDEKCVVFSGALACIGMTSALIWRQPSVALVGFMLTGLGLANMVPVMFAAAARVQGVHAAEGIARVAAMGYVGFLLGPVLIGLVAHATTLPIGLSLVVLCAALVASLGPHALRARGS